MTTVAAPASFSSTSFESTSKRVARRLLIPQVVVEVALAAAAPAPGVHVDLQLAGRLDRLPRLLGDDADEVLLDDDLHDAGHAADRALVDADERRADRRRPDDAAVQHAGHAHVVDVLELAGDHRRDLDARHRLAEHRPFARMLALARRVERQMLNVRPPTSSP